MRVVDLIIKKRDGYALSDEEIRFLITEYTNGNIPDYQMSALTMAIYFNGMNSRELGTLTMAMVESGDQVDLSSIQGIKVDKHSTGGVGDTTTLILAPLVASVGVPVAKMSGRGLGHTGGTIDKLEAIQGFQVEIPKERFIDLVNRDGVAVVGQSGNLTPADKKLYALRDVTGTVESIPLIASSIMSKKIAAGADAIVLDVKVGDGAFMKTLEDAEALAHAMVEIGKEVGRQTMAVISDMSQPLGYAIGNALEVKEAIATLKGEGPSDLTELVLTLGSQMVVLAQKANTLEEARVQLEEAIQSGAAFETFETFVKNQGGDVAMIQHPEKLPSAQYTIDLLSEEEGYIEEIHAEEMGIAAMQLGAGRATKDDVIDLGVGIVLHKKVGDQVNKGDSLLTIYSQTDDIAPIIKHIKEHIHIGPTKKEPTLIHEIIID